ISRTRTGSARALSRRATCRASASDIAPAAMGEQQTGAVTSRTGRALGTSSTYIELDEHQIIREPLRHPSKKEHRMSRVQLALNVDDLQASIAFYSKLFNAQPHKVKPGYANFAVAEPPLKLVLIENPGSGGSLNHLGVEVASSDEVH